MAHSQHKLLAVTAMACIALSACSFDPGRMRNGIQGSGNVIKQSRTVAAFDRVEIRGIGELTLRQGPLSVEVEADDNIIPLLESTVDNGRLTLKIRDNTSFRNINTLRWIVSTPDLTEIDLSGLARVDATDIKTPYLAVSISGGGQVVLRGEAESQKVSISGLGDANLSELTGKRGIVEISGGGQAHINISDALSAKITGLGEIKYRGNPTTSEEVSGLGTIRRE
jgi:Putative auto-transporter adhesin, head GIN domain